jgi:hypothetical protein
MAGIWNRGTRLMNAVWVRLYHKQLGSILRYSVARIAALVVLHTISVIAANTAIRSSLDLFAVYYHVCAAVLRCYHSRGS